MSNGRSDDNNGRSGFDSDDDTDNTGLYYYAYGSGDDHEDDGNHYGEDDDHEDNGNHYGQDEEHHDDNEVKIDFDSGVLTVGGGYDTSYAWGYYSDGQYGTYTEDGFTLEWDTYDFYSELGNSDNLGAAIFDASNSDSEHANEHADDFVFGINFVNGSNDLNDGYEYAFGILTKDDGGAYSLEDLEVTDTQANNNPAAFAQPYDNYAELYVVDYFTGGFEYKSIYSFDALDWNYQHYTYDFGTGTIDVIASGSGTLDDVLEVGLLDDVVDMGIYTAGNLVVDDIELEITV